MKYLGFTATIFLLLRNTGRVVFNDFKRSPVIRQNSKKIISHTLKTKNCLTSYCDPTLLVTLPSFTLARKGGLARDRGKKI